ncbi:MAG: hypothetical protein Kow0031_28990 [Anaerolineae bacterium]
MTSTAENNTRALIRAIQAGHPLNGITAADCGPWQDIMAEAIRAYEHGTEAAMRVVATEPALLRLTSEEQFTTPPTLAEVEPAWLGIKAVLDAFGRSEVGDAEILAHLYHERLAYDHSEKLWYIWTGYHWQLDHRRQIWNLVPNQVAAQYIRVAAELVKIDREKK